MSLLSFTSPDISSNLHLWIFQIPSLQNIREKLEKDGKPFVLIKGADLSVRFPDEGLFFSSRSIRRETERIADFLRTKLPENNLDQKLTVNCLIEEKDIRFDSNKNKIVFRQVDFDGRKNLMFWIEGKKAIGPDKFIINIKIKVKSGSDSKVMEKSGCLWNINEQMYLGFISGSEKNEKDNVKLKSKKGDIYFIVLLNERDKVEN
ncbi:MAG: hypothetical protein ACPLPQ_10845 [Candidatus Saccharicenans sp.]